jgi:hypothetical protein
MATLVAVFSESKQRFFPCTKCRLPVEIVRRVLASRYRYCLGEDQFYIPLEQPGRSESDRLCWVRDRQYFSLHALNDALDEGRLDWSGVRIGNSYVKRRMEVDGRFMEVETFVAQQLYDGASRSLDALGHVSKSDFENLCAEIFVRRGFEVDLFRGVKDGGIDFLAVRNDDLIPTIFAVQCKQPDQREGKNRKSLGRPVVQQIYGAAKAWDLSGAIAISGSTYSKKAAGFAANKPAEIEVVDAESLLDWLKKYKWNEDE